MDINSIDKKLNKVYKGLSRARKESKKYKKKTKEYARKHRRLKETFAKLLATAYIILALSIAVALFDAGALGINAIVSGNIITAALDFVGVGEAIQVIAQIIYIVLSVAVILLKVFIWFLKAYKEVEKIKKLLSMKFISFKVKMKWRAGVIAILGIYFGISMPDLVPYLNALPWLATASFVSIQLNKLNNKQLTRYLKQKEGGYDKKWKRTKRKINKIGREISQLLDMKNVLLSQQAEQSAGGY